MTTHWTDVRGIKKYFSTGSRVICNPPIMNTDIDYVVLIKNTEQFVKDLEDIGFSCIKEDISGYNIKEGLFVSLRKDQINLIITETESFYNKFLAFTNEARSRNLTKKSDRVVLCKSFLYGTNFTRSALMFWLDMKGFKRNEK